MARTPSRTYTQPTGSEQRIRTMRMIMGVRKLIVDAALQEDADGLDGKFVEYHKRWHQELTGHFDFLEIRGNAYASDVAHKLAKDIVYYILHGDTPGGDG